MSTTAPVALITGAAKRVGRAIAQRLAQGGFDVAFTYLHSLDEAEELSGLITAMGRRVLAIRADLTSPEEATEAISFAFEQQFDRLDTLVNNASIYEPGGLRSATNDQMHKFWSVHVEAPLLLVRAFEQRLRDAGGHIVNMVDLTAERPVPEYLMYCVSKAALANLTLGLARELAPQVTVNGIAPGVVQWPDAYPPEQREIYLKRVPLARAGTPEDVAEMVHFLCTAGSYVTGQILRVDGGRSVT